MRRITRRFIIGLILGLKKTMAVLKNTLMRFWRRRSPISTSTVDYFTEPFIGKLTKDEAKFILDHAEKQLKETLDTNLLIVNRTTTLLTVTIGFMVALVGFAVNRWEKNSAFDSALATACTGLVYLFFMAILLCRNIQPRKYITLGAPPKAFFNEALFSLESDFRLIHIYANEIESYQTRINTNHTTNEERWRLFNTCLIWLAATPMILAALYLIFNI